MKKVFAVILSALMLLSCASAMAEGTFRVGMECNYAPYNWTQAEPSEFTVPCLLYTSPSPRDRG